MPTTSDDRSLDAPARLAALEALGLGRPEDSFDRASRLASRALDAPVGLVSIVMDDRQVFAGRYGLAEPWATTRQTPLSHSFCQHVVVSRDVVAVEDANHDDRVRGNGAIEDLGVIAYLGMPLYGLGEQVLGSFCVIDSQPRQWTDEDREVLADAAAGVQRELDLRATIRDLNDARRDRDNLLQVVAHDLRSPLTTVMVGAQVLGRDDLPPERREQVRDAVARQSQRMAAMAARLLGGELDVPDQASRIQPLDALVERVVTARSVAGFEQRLAIAIGEGTDVPVQAEAATSIVSNLVDNALQYTRGQVRVEVTRRGDEVVLVVDDDGPGYDAQAVAEGRQAARGFGLGRAIVAHHVAELGGRREILTGPDRGTMAMVTIPVGY